MSKLLTLQRPTTISKLLQEAPEHADSRPLANITLWSDVMPSGKLPDRRFPLNSNLSRSALGDSIGQFPRSHGFDLQDPFIQIALKDYNVLHDKHLQKFWTEAMKKNLKRRGLIDEKEKVECSIKEFNEFRCFLYLQIRKRIQRQLAKMDNERKDQHYWLKVQDSLNYHEDYNEKLLIRKERAEILLSEKLKRWRDAVENYQQRIKTIILEQTRDKQQRRTEGHRREMLNSIRCEELFALRKKNVLVLKRRLRERDASLQQRICTNQRRKAEIRSTMRQQHFWLHFMAYGRESIEAREALERCLAETHLKVIGRKERYIRQHKHLEEDLVRRKTRNLAQRYERRSKKALVHALLKECQKSVWKLSSEDSPAGVQQTIEGAIDAAYAIQTTLSHTTSSTLIIDTASQFILDLREKPAEALPLDKLTMNYVVDRLRIMMELVLQATVRQGLALIEQVLARKLVRIDNWEQNVRSSLSDKWCVNAKEPAFAARPKNMQSRVSIGPVSILEEYETDSFSFKKCKNRPPTPVTSASSLVECSLGQTEMERFGTCKLELSADSAHELDQRIRSDDYPLIHIMYSQRRYLEGNLLKYRMIVEPYVEQRVFACVADLERLAVAGKETSEVEKDKLLHRTADALLKFPANAYQYANALSDTVNYVSTEAIAKISHVLNEV